MTFTFVILAVVTLAGAMAAMSLRNLVHCALCLVAAFGGLAGLFLQLGAQFVGLAQVLVYIGAVAILIVFAILLTRGSEPPQQPILAGRWLMGVAVAALTFGSLMVTIVTSALISPRNGPKLNFAADISVKDIGAKLMTEYVLPLEVVGLLLTAALIGAVIIAMEEKARREPEGSQSH